MIESSQLPVVVVAGPLPPPVHGQSKNTKILVDDLRGSCDLRIANLSAGSLERGISYHVMKLTRAVRAVGTILRASTSRRRKLYVSTDGGLGLIYNLVLVTFGRLLGFEIYLHHRSFSFIDRRSRLMAAVATIAGRRAQHIFLCPAMADRYRVRYRNAVQTRIVSNAMHVKPVATLSEYDGERSEWLRIGLLSNLGPEKGLMDFLDLLRAANRAGLPIQGILAGPPSSESSAVAIETARREMGELLEYRGAVYGLAKEEFFGDIDVFVFPTRYPVEAQPNVIFEAMAVGVPVISYGRGCVATELKDSGMLVIPQEHDFVSAALPALKLWTSDVAAFEEARISALEFVNRLVKEAQDQYDALLVELAG